MHVLVRAADGGSGWLIVTVCGWLRVWLVDWLAGRGWAGG